MASEGGAELWKAVKCRWLDSFKEQLVCGGQDVFPGIWHTNCWCNAETNVRACFEKTHPSIVVIGHFTPTRPVCLNLCNQRCWRKGFFFSLPELLPFFHWLHMFNNDEKKKEFSAGRCWFSARYLRVTSPSLWLTSVAATDVDVLRLWKGRRRDDLRVNSTGGTDHGPIMSVTCCWWSSVWWVMWR